MLDSPENLDKHKKDQHKRDVKKLEDLHALSESIVSKLGKDASLSYVKPKRFKLSVPVAKLIKTAQYLKEDVGYDHVESVSGVDWPQEVQFEVVYHLASHSRKELKDNVLSLSTRVPRNKATSPSLESIWKSSEFHERETHEMFGIKFKGHPRLDRLLLPEDWCDIPPMRKEFQLPRRTK
ncbi:MAG: NADH-quinone oxidoreductase subunit C [Nitrososphaerales archaeon]